MTIDEAVSRCKITKGDKIRMFGGWYRHDVVTLDGKQIGRIQIRRRNKRTDVLTLDNMQSAVLGQYLPWLVRQHLMNERMDNGN